METVQAWHFTGDTLRDGRPVPPVGETLVHDGPLEMCASGLHASRRLIDALRYAPGHMIHRVEMGGEIVKDTDKLVATERTILWTVDGEDLLCDFARQCALDVIHLWDAPDGVREYLTTGDESLRDAASDAARDAASAAASAAARAAARGAAWAASWAVARDAAWAAARDAARAAARAAAWDAAWDAAWGAAWAAARDAARAAAGIAQDRRLTMMVLRSHRRTYEHG